MLRYPVIMAETPFEFEEQDYPLAAATLYGVGGAARTALLPRTREEVVEAYVWMCQQEAPRLILGGGSNVLIRDGGFPGIVLFTHCLKHTEELGDDRYFVEAGLELDTLVQNLLVAKNYAGTGGLTGIPGSVGGAIFMNAGTVNGSICELMESVDVVRADGEQRIPMDPSLYGYRGQTFCPADGLILGGTFSFHTAEEDQRAIYERYIERRKTSQPQGKSCGSVFKNPEGDHAGRLIEACGLKGQIKGGAAISDLHANFILNRQEATCADIVWLIGLCKKEVRDKVGIALEEEVRIFGIDLV